MAPCLFLHIYRYKKVCNMKASRSFDSGNETKTCDLYLAACLVTAQVKFSNTSVLNNRVYFHFNNDEGMVDRIKREYLARQLQIDALSYSDNIKSLKSFCAEILKRN